MNLLFPVETINRELDFRLVLAALSASPERTAYVGQHDALHRIVPTMEGGVFVGKSIIKSLYATDHSRYHALKAAGFDVVYIHEEGAFFSGDESDWGAVLEAQYDLDLFGEDDYVCVWGELQAEMDRARRPEIADRVRVTGHPRFDVYKPEWRRIYQDRARAIRDELGRYVLVNTNMSYANHGLGPLHPFTAAGRYPSDPQARLAHVSRWSYGSVMRARFVALIHGLAGQFPDLTIVLRPHPSEDHGFYRTALNGVSNVTVRHEGPVGPWIVGSEVMLHNGCTTAMEAYFAGKPVITYRPTENAACEIQVPNLLGTVCETDAEVSAALAGALGETPELAPAPERVRRVIHNVGHDAFAALVGVVDEAAGQVRGPVRVPTRAALRLRHGRDHAVTKTKDWIYGRMPNRRRQIEYYRTAFYGFDYPDIERKMAIINRQTSRPVRVEPVSDALFTVHTA